MIRSGMFVCALVFLAVAIAPGTALAEQLRFRVVFDADTQTEAYTGRVYVALAAGGRGEPREQMGAWFDPPPLFALDVEGVPVGGSVVVDGTALAHPTPLAEISAGTYSVQAVARRNPDHPKPGRGAGDLCSAVTKTKLDPGTSGEIELVLSEIVAADEFRETDSVRLFEMVSPSLSAFHGREITLRAGVVLPDGWADDTRHPTVYHIGGFGGTHFSAHGVARRRGPEGSDARKILWVVPDPSCALGHSVFADSANNGPWGSAFITELIPAVEEAFGGAGEKHRYVTGGSSGGWASLWLQVTYPDAFAGCWAHVPDPVDFHDFQQVDMYRPGSSMYRDEHDGRRPLARRDGKVMVHYDDFVAREEVVGPGGQIHSFEAVFSPRGADGRPVRVFDRETGAVDTDATTSWRRYDLNAIIRERWDELGATLEPKLHVYAGSEDTFYLEGAVRRLAATMKELGSSADVRVIEGLSHQLYVPGHRAMLEEIIERWESRAGG